MKLWHVLGFFSLFFSPVVFALFSLAMSCLFCSAGDIKQEGGGFREGPPYQRRGSLQLWQFLVALLDNPTNSHFIAWTGRGMEFKLIEPEEVKPLRFSAGSGESPTGSGAANSAKWLFLCPASGTHHTLQQVKVFRRGQITWMTQVSGLRKACV